MKFGRLTPFAVIITVAFVALVGAFAALTLMDVPVESREIVTTIPNEQFYGGNR